MGKYKCCNCGKESTTARWDDSFSYDEHSGKVSAVVDYEGDGEDDPNGTFNIDPIYDAVMEALIEKLGDLDEDEYDEVRDEVLLISQGSEDFPRDVIDELEFGIEDSGAHCPRCNAIL